MASFKAWGGVCWHLGAMAQQPGIHCLILSPGIVPRAGIPRSPDQSGSGRYKHEAQWGSSNGMSASRPSLPGGPSHLLPPNPPTGSRHSSSPSSIGHALVIVPRPLGSLAHSSCLFSTRHYSGPTLCTENCTPTSLPPSPASPATPPPNPIPPPAFPSSTHVALCV